MILYTVIIIFFATSAVVFFILYLRAQRSLHERNEISKAIWNIDQVILNTLDFEKVITEIVNAALSELSKFGYAILVLSLIDEKSGVLKRISISRTEEASKALRFSPIPFDKIQISLDAEKNLNIKAIREKKALETKRLADLLTPVIDPHLADDAQRAAGIKISLVYPVAIRGVILGTLIFSTTKDDAHISWYEREIMTGFVDAVGIAIENSSLYKRLHNISAALENANTRLKELDQLKDDFVSVASHELRTPMTAIRSYVWMALYKPDIDLSERMKKYLSRTLTSTERLIKLVNDMLNVSRIESGRVEVIPSVFNMQEMLKEVVSELTPRAQEKSINIVVDPEEVPKIFADQDKVHQILLNIIGNALKFTPFEGKIEVNFFSDGITLETSIKDNGVGISKDDIGRLFRKFGRLDNSYVAAATSGGTGLGLYISKSLVELMKGTIKVYSDGIGKGTTFTFSLPVATPKVLADVQKYTYLVKEGEAKPLEPAAI